MTSDIDVREYWERRLSADWSLRGVGLSRLGTQLNDWQYRLRDERFAAVVEGLALDLSNVRVLDIGSGTGFYIDAWTRFQAKEVVGLDLTDAAVQRLRDAFPDVNFVQSDITEGTAGLSPESFGVVSCMDVMFHVVDNSKFQEALNNIATLLEPGGVFIWSDFFVHGREMRSGHIVWRNLYRVEAMLDRAGFDVLERRPLFYLMNEPRDSNLRMAVTVWKLAMWLVSRNEKVADVVGRLLYRIDRRLMSRRTESPSTEVMVCRKRTAWH